MKLLVATIASLLVSCESCQTAKAPADDYQITTFPPDEAGIDAESPRVPADCHLACANLAKLGCPESAPSGRSCGSVCAYASSNGFDMQLACVAKAASADQVRACCPSGKPGCTPTRCKGK